MSGREHPDGYTSYDGIGYERLSLSAWRVMVRELIDYWELIRRLVIRNIAGQFRQSFLGYIWIMLPPIATTVVFSVLQKARVVNIEMPEGSMPYAIFALLGMTVWGYFTQLTMMATTSISNAGGLVSKIYFPREVLVLSAVGNAIVNFLIRLVVVVLTFLLLQYAPHWEIVYYVVLLIPFTLLGVGLGLLLAPINTMMNDVGRLMEFAFQFGMFLAPTVYPTPDIATANDTWQSLLFWAHQVNPVSHYLYAAHELVQHGTLTFGPGLQAAVILSFLVFLVGWRFFHAIEPLLAERV